jgi:hypothetical protein
MCYFGNNWDKETIQERQREFPLVKSKEKTEKNSTTMENVVVAEK